MDIKTLVLALALGNLSLCAALFFGQYEQKKSSVLSVWSVAKQCQALAWMLVYLRGIVPDLLSILLANGLLFAGVALDAGVFLQASGRSGWRRLIWPLLVLAIAAFLACYLVDVAPALRLAAGALIVALFALIGVGALALGWSGAAMLQRFLVVVMGALALLIGARGVVLVLLPGGWGWLSPALLQVAGFVALYLMMLSNGFGYLLLARERLRAQMAQLEVQDSVTGVPNRRGFFNALAPWMALARRPGMPTALIVLNLDHFKRVNDSYGHQVGDMLLKNVVDLCQNQLRDSDLIGRLGGAEFAIQLPRTALADALLVAERMRAAIAVMPLKTERAVLNLTASLGVAVIRADDSVVTLFQRADEALQTAKRDGHNRVAAAFEPAPP